MKTEDIFKFQDREEKIEMFKALINQAVVSDMLRDLSPTFDRDVEIVVDFFSTIDFSDPGNDLDFLHLEEEITVDADTGGEKGSKEARFDLIPVYPLWELARVFGRGAKKYAERNWEKGYVWSKTFSSMMRHAWSFWAGEDDDPETGLPHMAHVAWHAFVLLEFMKKHRDKDNRAPYAA